MWRIYLIWVALAVGCGVVWGGSRGIGYVPTLFFAFVEGGILVGVPTAAGGLVVVGAYSLFRGIGRRKDSHPGHRI